jgi:phosphocarrier protein HPr
MAAPAGPQGELIRIVAIVNAKGLHARAAAKFARVAAQFKAEVTVKRADMAVSARSIMGLMMLAAAKGTDIALHATGEDAAAALDALATLVAQGFGEA